MNGKTLGLIQAHAQGWDGSLGHSLIQVVGRPAIQGTLERLLETPGLDASHYCIAVPDEGVKGRICARGGVNQGDALSRFDQRCRGSATAGGRSFR